MTRNIFDQIAPGWYNFRHWSIFRRELEALAERWGKGRLLNIGCAHGPDFLPFRRDFELFGVDFSARMLELAGKYSRKFEFTVDLVQADACHLPFACETFDRAIAVATYHHIKGEENRQMAFDELNRVLKPGGEAFITVWNRWQPGFWSRGRDTTVPWKTGGKTYHLFSYFELEGLAEQSDLTVLKSFPESSYRFPLKFFSRNICLLVKK